MARVSTAIVLALAVSAGIVGATRPATPKLSLLEALNGTEQSLFNRTAFTGSDAQALKANLMKTEVFKNKVKQICKQREPIVSCEEEAEEALFCQLLSRSRPELAGTVCKSGGAVIEQAVPAAALLEVSVHRGLRTAGPEDDLAQEMTHDLEMNFNKIAPFGKEDTAKELQDHAAKTQDTLVDAVENAEVAEIKRAVFRALTRLRAATIKEFDTIARLETQAIDAYNDAHHYRAENPLAHLHEDEAPVETDKLKSFH